MYSNFLAFLGFSPTSPTAILTLQLSNLSMIPIANPSKQGQIEEIGNAKEEFKEQSTTEENIKFEAIIPKVIEKIQEEVQRFSKSEKEKDLPYVVQEISDRRNFRMLPYSKSQDEEYFGSVVDGIKTVIQGHLVRVGYYMVMVMISGCRNEMNAFSRMKFKRNSSLSLLVWKWRLKRGMILYRNFNPKYRSLR